MKDKIMIFIIGILVGAVVSTGVFYIYTISNSNNCNSGNNQMTGGQPPEMPNGQNNTNGTPPEKPSDNNTQENNQNSNNS